MAEKQPEKFDMKANPMTAKALKEKEEFLKSQVRMVNFTIYEKGINDAHRLEI